MSDIVSAQLRPVTQQMHAQVVHAMDKLGRPADKMRIKKVLEEFYRSVHVSWAAALSAYMSCCKPSALIGCVASSSKLHNAVALFLVACYALVTEQLYQAPHRWWSSGCWWLSGLDTCDVFATLKVSRVHELS